MGFIAYKYTIMNILIPAAGKGSRFVTSKYNLPKPNILVDNSPMLVASAKSLSFNGQFIFIIQENAYRNELAVQLKQSFEGCKIAVIDFYTDGAAETAMIAKDLIDNDEELVIANCDQIMGHNWNSEKALKQLRRYDAGLVTVTDTDPKHSYAEVKDNLVTKVVEKQVISNEALTGIHYWKQGKYFIKSVEQMFADKDMNTEYYIGPTYNYLIADNYRVGTYHISKNEINFVGTPKDLEIYESRKTI